MARLAFAPSPDEWLIGHAPPRAFLLFYQWDAGFSEPDIRSTETRRSETKAAELAAVNVERGAASEVGQRLE